MSIQDPFRSLDVFTVWEKERRDRKEHTHEALKVGRLIFCVVLKILVVAHPGDVKG